MAVLSISRQFGAGGKSLGKRVAQRLQYQFVDEALLHKVAEQADVSLDWVQAVQKEAGGLLMRFMSSLVPSSFMDRHLGDSGSDFDERRYVEFLTSIINGLAAEDNVVILGRGSQFILRPDPKVLRVLLVAERGDRIKFMEDHYGLAPDRAEAMVLRETRKRERFLANFHKGDPNDPTLYHMVLNTSLLSLEVAEEQITELVLNAVDASAEPIWD